MKKNKRLFGTLGVCIMLFSFYFQGAVQGEVLNVKIGKIKAGNVTVWQVDNVAKVLEDVKRLNLNTVNVPIQVDIPHTSASKMEINEVQKQQAIHLIQELLKRNIQVIVEPFPYIQQGNIGETEWSPSNINAFFWNWKTVVLQDIFETITSKYNIYGLKIASNFVNMEYAEGYWNDTINFVRQQYKGNVLYQMNWWSTASWDSSYEVKFIEKIHRPYLKKVDIVSIDSWFEVSGKQNSTYEEIKKSLYATTVYNRGQNVIQQLEQLHNVTGKPIYFGGFNIPAREFGLQNPWNPDVSKIFSSEVQSNGWRAFRDGLEPKPYFKGFSIWFISSNDQTHAYQIHSKEAETVIKDWYKKIN
ncbi:glycoside hydrolase family 113 [Bacillus cereus]|uniref:glycoside hydrolase family 113 n=1 Tax=Bacillus cereus TaxID=1396 RepID=UPI00397F8DD9